MTRPGLEEFALLLAETASVRSQDPKHKVGAAVLAVDGRVLGIGYNGPPPGVDLTKEQWADRDLVRDTVVHAETNALIGVEPGEARLLATTLGPCTRCIGIAVRLGIHHIVSRAETPSSHSSGVEGTRRRFGVTMDILPVDHEERRVTGANDYQVKTRRTGGEPSELGTEVWVWKLINFALGVAGEGGEVADEVKKFLFHGQSLEDTQTKVKKELGDDLWYLTRMADIWGIPLVDLMQANIDKLWDRYPRGFEEGGGVRDS